MKKKAPVNHQNNGQILLGQGQDIGYGGKRTRLQDRLLAEKLTTQGGLEIYLGAIADGVGGANAGERAAEIVIETVRRTVQNSTQTDINAILKNAVSTAHKTVRAEIKNDPRVRQMSTTATVAAIHDSKLYLAHVGDSRAYLIRDGRIQQLTLDHTWGNEKVREGAFTLEEVSKNPRRDDLARYIGQNARLEIDLGLRLSDDLHPARSQLQPNGLALKPGDVVVLCSDGLIKERHDLSGRHYVEAHEIVQAVERKRHAPTDVANTLVSLALGRKTDDNVSVVIMEVPGGKAKLFPRPALSARALALLVGVGLFLLLVAGFVLIRSFTTSPAEASQPALPTNSVAATAGPTLPPPSAGNINVLAARGDVSFQEDENSPPIRPQAGQPVPIRQGSKIWTNNGTARLDVGRGNVIVLGPNTTLRFAQAANTGGGSAIGTLLLERGQLLASGSNVAVEAATHSFAASADGTLGIEYAPLSGDFVIDCLTGVCTVDNKGGQSQFLQAGERGGFQQGVLGNTPLQAGYSLWLELAPDLVPTPTPTPTATPTPMPTATPTPTATPPLPTQPPAPQATPTKEKKQDDDEEDEKPPPPPPSPPAATDTPDPGRP